MRADKEAFNILYSRVPTEATTDVKVHAKKMEEYFSNFKFNENARMLSVIVHDNLDGNTLFVGHVGVLVPAKDGYLFVEKLTFERALPSHQVCDQGRCLQILGDQIPRLHR